MQSTEPMHRARRLLDACIQAQGLRTGEYTYFFVTGEGRFLPISEPEDEVEEASGYVLTHDGEIYFFWFGWDPEREAPALIRWRRAEPQPHWEQSAEYRQARERMQLPCA
jgi:hypothetical protein